MPFPEKQTYEASDKVFTIPNVISFLRLCLIPVFFSLLHKGYDIPAALVFGIAAGTDWVDGRIARRTNSVSKVGQLLDPTVDRLLMLSGVLGAYLVDRLPLWIIVVVLIRDVGQLIGGAYALQKYKVRTPVIFPGKVATTFLFVGFFGLLLNWPRISGLGLVSFTWLPGFNHAMCSWGIWCVYIGLIIGIFTTAYYVTTTARKCLEIKHGSGEESTHHA